MLDLPVNLATLEQHIIVIIFVFTIVAGEQDYIPFTSTLSKPLSNETRSQCFDVSIIDDNLFELTESFTLLVTLADDTQPVIISPSVAIIEIVDDDGKSHNYTLEGSVCFSTITMTL